jgi:hypothetical protein
MELKIGYLAVTLFTNLFILLIGYKAINATSSSTKKDKTILLLGLTAWQVFIFAIAQTGIIKSYDFPPVFTLVYILPSFLFTGVFLFRNRNKEWIQSIPAHWIVYFQSFRIAVETLFIFSFAPGIFNVEVTLEGYNFDMVFALTAPVIGFLVYTKKVLSNKVVVIWNYIGLLVLSSVIFLFLTSIYKPEMYGSTTPLLPLESMEYPYVLIAGFLMPVAVFLHVLSILQFSGIRE